LTDEMTAEPRDGSIREGKELNPLNAWWGIK
jgi:hypothetical protein